ncbi:MAG: response regulator [Candidatus Hadarchaeia archaeon]
MSNIGLAAHEEVDVLFIDDDPHVLDQARAFLEEEYNGFNVETTQSGERGLKAVEERGIDVIVSDLKMPGVNGIELLKQLREKDLNVPFIVFTGKGNEEAAMNALNLGANRYIRKDRNPRNQYEELAHSIREVLKRKMAEEREEFLNFLLRHDLRSKLQITKGYHELIGESDLPGEVEMYLNKAKKGIQEGVELIEKVRTLQKVGKEQIGDVSLMPVIKNSVSGYEARATQKGIGIEVRSEDPLIKVKGGALIEDLFSNLINNAIRHSGGSKILIEVEVGDDTVVGRVEDDGKGIPDEAMEKIFKRGFKKGDTAGSGLGLSIVKGIAESYGGKVEVGSSELGGSKFEVYLRRKDRE